MLKKVVYVALLVSDQDKALDFYTNVVGFEKRGDFPTGAGAPRFLTVGVKGQDFELVLWPGTPGKPKAGSAVYTIEVESCQTAFETLKSRGVKFDSDAGSMVCCMQPDSSTPRPNASRAMPRFPTAPRNPMPFTMFNFESIDRR
jgi:catechol 2,3-dioxygenase-like lactoylglutathione lyase family enzyme